MDDLSASLRRARAVARDAPSIERLTRLIAVRDDPAAAADCASLLEELAANPSPIIALTAVCFVQACAVQPSLRVALGGASGWLPGALRLLCASLASAEPRVRMQAVAAMEAVSACAETVAPDAGNAAVLLGCASAMRAAVVRLAAGPVAASATDASDGSAIIAPLVDCAALPAWQKAEALTLALRSLIRGSQAVALTTAGDTFRNVCQGVLTPASPSINANQYLREAAFHLLDAIIGAWAASTAAGPSAAAGADDVAGDVDLPAAFQLLARGAADAHPQVRFAACIALRTALALHRAAFLDHLHLLLPPLCLSRYYGSERQRGYCQNTWKLLVLPLQGDEPPAVAVSSDSSATGGPGHGSLGSPVLLGGSPSRAFAAAAGSGRVSPLPLSAPATGAAASQPSPVSASAAPGAPRLPQAGQIVPTASPPPSIVRTAAATVAPRTMPAAAPASLAAGAAAPSFGALAPAPERSASPLRASSLAALLTTDASSSLSASLPPSAFSRRPVASPPFAAGPTSPSGMAAVDAAAISVRRRAASPVHASAALPPAASPPPAASASGGASAALRSGSGGSASPTSPPLAAGGRVSPAAGMGVCAPNAALPTGAAGGSVAGPALVAAHIDAVASFYVAQLSGRVSPAPDALPAADTTASSSTGPAAAGLDVAGAEAASHCISELASKIDRAVVAPHAQQLLAALLGAITPAVAPGDASSPLAVPWEVLDAATVASGRLVAGFAAETAPLRTSAMAAWLRCVRASHPMVRDHAAMVIGMAIRAPLAGASTAGAKASAPVATSAVAVEGSGSDGATSVSAGAGLPAGLFTRARPPASTSAQPVDAGMLAAAEVACRAGIDAIAGGMWAVSGGADAVDAAAATGGAATGATPAAAVAGSASPARVASPPCDAFNGSILLLRELAPFAPSFACDYLVNGVERLAWRGCLERTQEAVFRRLPEIAAVSASRAAPGLPLRSPSALHLTCSLLVLMILPCRPSASSRSSGA